MNEHFCKAAEDVNVIIAMYSDVLMGVVRETSKK